MSRSWTSEVITGTFDIFIRLESIVVQFMGTCAFQEVEQFIIGGVRESAVHFE